MEIFTAICEDRHVDTHVRVFDTLDKAITYAKKFIGNNTRHSEDIQKSDVDGWLYYATYSCEGDFVRVESSILNDVS